jgi:ferrous iron transport protein A
MFVLLALARARHQVHPVIPQCKSTLLVVELSVNVLKGRSFRAKHSFIMTRQTVPLCSAPRGSQLIIIDIPAGMERTRLIRLGVMKGEVIQCVERLPGGTVVLGINRQEIAIGASLAKTILVECVGYEQASRQWTK